MRQAFDSFYMLYEMRSASCEIRAAKTKMREDLPCKREYTASVQENDPVAKRMHLGMFSIFKIGISSTPDLINASAFSSTLSGCMR